MGITATFDTLQYAKKLQEAGFTAAQAEIQAEALAEIVGSELATKRDLKELEVALSRDLKELELRLVIRLGTIVVIAVGIVATLVKLL